MSLTYFGGENCGSYDRARCSFIPDTADSLHRGTEFRKPPSPFQVINNWKIDDHGEYSVITLRHIGIPTVSTYEVQQISITSSSVCVSTMFIISVTPLIVAEVRKVFSEVGIRP